MYPKNSRFAFLTKIEQTGETGKKISGDFKNFLSATKKDIEINYILSIRADNEIKKIVWTTAIFLRDTGEISTADYDQFLPQMHSLAEEFGIQ